MYQHETRPPIDPNFSDNPVIAARTSLAEKESKVLRLQQKLANTRERLADTEAAVAAAADTHAAEVAILRQRVEAADAAKRRAVTQQEKAQHQLESMQLQQQAVQTQQRHLLEDAQEAGWESGFRAEQSARQQAEDSLVAERAQASAALEDAQVRVHDGNRRASQLAEELAYSERQRANDVNTPRWGSNPRRPSHRSPLPCPLSSPLPSPLPCPLLSPALSAPLPSPLRCPLLSPALTSPGTRAPPWGHHTQIG